MNKTTPVKVTKPTPRLEVDVTLKLDIYWCPDDFKGSNLSWYEFCGRMVIDQEYAKKQVAHEMLNSMDNLLGYEQRNLKRVQVRYVIAKEH